MPYKRKAPVRKRKVYKKKAFKSSYRDPIPRTLQIATKRIKI